MPDADAGGATGRRRPVWRPGVRRTALAVGLVFAFWVHAEAFARPATQFYEEVRWPYVMAGVFVMLFATVRPMRWMIIAVATGAPTALTGCYFIGSQLARGGGVPWLYVRMGVTMLLAVVIGGMIGRVAGGIRSGR